MKQLLGLIFMLIVSVAAYPDTRSFLEKEVRYWGIERTMSEEDMKKLIELKAKTDLPGLSQTQRATAYGDLFRFVRKLRGAPDGGSTDQTAQLAASWWNTESPDQSHDLRVSKPGQLGDFAKTGTGKIAMILIPDIGAGRSVWNSFTNRNAQRYTMFAVTLPGFAGTAPPARPKLLDFGTPNWWNNAEQAIVNLIRTEKLNRPVLVGHQAGAYLAMKIALNHPDLVRGVVVLNGLLYAPLPGQQGNPDKQTRVKIVNQWVPVELFPTPTRDQYRSYVQQGAGWLCKDKKRQMELAEMMSSSNARVWWKYFAELMATDLSEEIKSLKVPLLVLPSVHDQKSPGNKGWQMVVDQLKNFAKENSQLPIQVTPIENCRVYATEDQPAKLDEAVANWVTASKL